MFSIIIPTWNNLPFLKLCVESIQKYAIPGHQIIIHVNEGSDGTLDWVKTQRLDYTCTPKNEGVCVAVNMAAARAKHDYIAFVNDDMFMLPGWDAILMEEIKSLDTDCFMLSATMIEPYDTRNKCVIVGDYGRSIESFEREKLLAEYKTYRKAIGAVPPGRPIVVHKKWWNSWWL